MEIVITQWALDSYLELKHEEQFSNTDYKGTIRPDVLLLLQYPKNVRFDNGKFWSQATIAGNPLSCGFKMKWHNLGDRRIQLRLPVGLGFPDKLAGLAFLLNAYVKSDAKFEARQLVKMRTRLQLIKKQIIHERGRLK
jgi:hypothetical protein